MKKILAVFIATVFILLVQKGFTQTPDNWTKDQLLEPSALAQTISSSNDIPVIFSVGPGALIPHSKAIGMVKDSVNLLGLKNGLKDLSKKAAIVIYCGCCPFEHCPNVRPAIALLNEGHFTNYKLLNLPHNIKTDWIDKGYPTEKK